MKKETIEKTLGIDLDTLFTLMSLNVPGTLGHTELRRDSESGRWWFSIVNVEEGHHYPLDGYGKTWKIEKKDRGTYYEWTVKWIQKDLDLTKEELK